MGKCKRLGKRKIFVKNMNSEKKVRFLSLKILVKSVLVQIFVAPLASAYYKFFIKHKGTYDIIICPHIGDFLYSVGYINAFVAEKKITNVRIICIKKYESLFQLYSNLNCEYYGIEKKKLDFLLLANTCQIGQRLFLLMGNNLVIEPANAFVLGNEYVKRYPHFNLRLCIKYGSFQLAENSPFDSPYVFKNNESTITSKKILICPFAQSIEQKEIHQMLCMLIPKLLSQGYQVLVNGQDEQFEKYNVTFVEWTLETFLENCKYLYSVIGVRSGIMDLAAFAKTKVIAIYPEQYELFNYYDLKELVMGNENIYQYVMCEDVNLDVEKILKLNER